MFDKPNEIGLTLNLLKPPKEFPVGCDFNQMFLSKKGNNYQMKKKNRYMIVLSLNYF